MVTPTPIPKRLLAVMEHAEAFEPIQGTGSISRRRFCSATWGTPAEYSVGLKFAISRGWLGTAWERHVREFHAKRRGPSSPAALAYILGP